MVIQAASDANIVLSNERKNIPQKTLMIITDDKDYYDVDDYN